jgi:hypothetical protein
MLCIKREEKEEGADRISMLQGYPVQASMLVLGPGVPAPPAGGQVQPRGAVQGLQLASLLGN